MGQNIVVTGMVLSAMPIGEYDKRITLLTKERGKITAFARGARRPNSQLLAASNPFSFGEFELFEGRSTYTVGKAAIQNYFRELTENFKAVYYGFYFLEYAQYCCQENNDEREMLKLLYQSLRALEHPVFAPALVRVIFEQRALVINGEAPNVFTCRMCGGRENLSWYSVKKGGMLCKSCAEKLEKKQLSAYRKLSESAVYTLQFIASVEITKLYTFTVSSDVLHELQQLMREYQGYYGNHSFQSLKILEEVENME